MADPKNDLASFAALCARLADPWAARASTLAAAGLADEPSLEKLRATWTARLAEDPAEREGFRAAFAEARANVHAGRATTDEARKNADVPLLASGDAPPLKKATAELHSPIVALRDKLDTTAEVMPRVLPEVPFVEVERDEFGIPKVVAAAIARGAAQREDTGTVALSPDAPPSGPATPFEKSRPPPAEEDLDLDATTEFRPDTKDKP
jgi:hypothetical protein